MSELWKARLLPGSFRGIPFFIESHEHSGGRHVKKHEPPGRNRGFSEDIGKRTPTYKIDAHVLGDNYFFIRDALVNAMESGLPGLLVHPYLGVLTVKPEGFTLTESTSEGRIAFFSMTFAENGDLFPLLGLVNEIVDFATQAVATVAAISTYVELAVKLSELPAFALESAATLVVDFADDVLENINNVRLKGSEHSALKRKTEKLKDEADEYIANADVVGVFSLMDEIISDLKDLVPDAPDSFTIDSSSGRDDQLAVFRPLLNFDGGQAAIDPITPTREQEKLNLQGFEDGIQQLAITRLSEKLSTKEFNTIDEATAARLEVSEAIERQLDKTQITDDVFQALQDLNAKLVRVVPNQSTNFVRTKKIEVLDSTPSIVLAYDLYESVEDEQDLINRNGVRKPGFVAGELEVLTRETIL